MMACLECSREQTAKLPGQPQTILLSVTINLNEYETVGPSDLKLLEE
ncbi:hypothetical protein C942_00030 [Photobacterium marinum]|uniref:Uncharacterized protein n=1 Tax=Photobacterium marinum TaxID=1056511 RepID=L8JHL2_9GAMM|nr:hypothetical protein C942_00030 [Photobacterium marinum]